MTRKVRRRHECRRRLRWWATPERSDQQQDRCHRRDDRDGGDPRTAAAFRWRGLRLHGRGAECRRCGLTGRARRSVDRIEYGAQLGERWPLGRVLREHRAHDAIEPRAGRRARRHSPSADHRRGASQPSPSRCRRRTAVRPASSSNAMAAERIDVGARVDRAAAWLARARCTCGVPTIAPVAVRSALCSTRTSFAMPKSSSLTPGASSARVDEEHVVGLEVAVDDALVVRGLERAGELTQDRAGLDSGRAPRA